MNPQSFSDSNSDTSQAQNLSEKVEILQAKLDRLQGLAQTLITGLVVGIIITLGVSGWFAYRLLVQEQVTQRQAEQFASTETELREKLQELEEQVATQERETETFTQELETMNSAVSSNQRQIELLRQQVNPDEALEQEETP